MREPLLSSPDGLLSAFIDAVKRDIALPWDGLLDYAEKVLAQIEGADSHRARQEVAALLEEALRRNQSGLPARDRPRAWELIVQLAQDPSQPPSTSGST